MVDLDNARRAMTSAVIGAPTMFSASWASISTADCASCGRRATMSQALFVGSMGDPCGLVDVCDECAPKVGRIAEALVDVLPPGAGAMLTNY